MANAQESLASRSQPRVNSAKQPRRDKGKYEWEDIENERHSAQRRDYVARDSRDARRLPFREIRVTGKKGLER